LYQWSSEITLWEGSPYGSGAKNHVERNVPMLTDVELIVLLPLDRATRALVWRYVAWCYATHVYIPATTCRVAPGWHVLAGWQ